MIMGRDRPGCTFRLRRRPGRPALTTSPTSGGFPRPDGNGTILAIAGVRPQGSLGVARLLPMSL
jgi:hypothetical protein